MLVVMIAMVRTRVAGPGGTTGLAGIRVLGAVSIGYLVAWLGQHLVAQPDDGVAHRLLQLVLVERAVRLHGGAAGGQVDHGIVHSGQERQAALDVRGAPCAGHAAHG